MNQINLVKLARNMTPITIDRSVPWLKTTTHPSYLTSLIYQPYYFIKSIWGL